MLIGRIPTILIFLLVFSFLISTPSFCEKKSEKKTLKDCIEEIEKLKRQLSSIKRMIRNAGIEDANRKIDEQKRKVAELNREITDLKLKLEEKDKDISFSGFFDVTASGYNNNPNIFDVGDFELDMEKSFGENFQVGAALTFNKDGAEMAVGFIDFHIFGGSIPARGRLFNEKGFHIQVGKFDIPFGNDWLYFASVDRASVTTPITTEIVMEGGLNDTGVRLLRGTVYYNMTLYLLKGTGDGISYGGRFGLTPFNNPYILSKEQIPPFELGFSYLRDNDKDGNKEDSAWALDFETNIGNLRFQGEYIRRSIYSIEKRVRGYHFSLFYSLKTFANFPVVLYGRYEWCKSELPMQSNSTASAFVAGFNLSLFDITLFKLEYRSFLKESEEYKGDSVYAQLVITF